MQESRAFLLAHRDGCARFLSLEVARSRGQSLVRGWNEPDKTLPYSDFRQCSAQETGVTGLEAGLEGQGHTGFTPNSLNTPYLQRETRDPSVTMCREDKEEQCTTPMAFAAAWCSGDSNRDVATHREQIMVQRGQRETVQQDLGTD